MYNITHIHHHRSVQTTNSNILDTWRRCKRFVGARPRKSVKHITQEEIDTASTCSVSCSHSGKRGLRGV